MSDPKSNGEIKKDDRWAKEQAKKKHARLQKVEADIEVLSGKITRVTEKFEAKFQEKIKPIQEEQKTLQAKAEAIAKSCRCPPLSDHAADESLSRMSGKSRSTASTPLEETSFGSA